MKVTVVPAQVTTVEDRIIGNLSMLQVMLLLGPVFGGALLFGLLPPFMEGAGYKYLLLSVLGLVFGVLSIRIKGQVLVVKLITLIKFYSRPGVYIYDKNSTYLKDMSHLTQPEEVPLDIGLDSRSSLKATSLPNLDVSDKVRAYEYIESNESEVSFKTDKKGRLYVQIAEAKSQR